MEPQVSQKVSSFFSRFKAASYRKGDTLISAGGVPTGVFYLEEGLVKQYTISQKGDEVIVNYFKSHAFFPMSWVVAEIPNNYYYEALTPVTVRKASKSEAAQFIKKNPDVTLDLLRRVYIGTEGLFMHIEHLMSGNAYAKLLTSMIIFAKRFGKVEEDGIHIDLTMTEHDLAAYSGVARETVSRELAKLANKDILTFHDHHLLIKNLNRLQEELTALA